MGARLSAIALLALTLRALIPGGYMLAEADVGSGRYLTVQMCDGHASPAKVIDLDTGKAVDPSALGDARDGEAPAPCVFAGAVALAQPVESVEPADFPVAYDVDFSPSRELRPSRGIAAPPPPSTGPPVTL